MGAFMALCAAVYAAGADGGTTFSTNWSPAPTKGAPSFVAAPPTEHVPPQHAPATPVDASHPSVAQPSSNGPPPQSITELTSSPPAVAYETAFPLSAMAGPSWRVQIDGIVMRPRWPDLELGIANTRNLGAPNGRIERLEFDPAIGFKLGFHRRLGSDSGFGAEHTYLSVDANNELFSQPGATVTPTLTHPLGLRDVDSGTASARHRSNVLDLLWAQRIHVGDGFDAWFEGGMRAAWLRRGFGVDYVGGDAAPIARIDHDLGFRGVGLCGGLAGTWCVGAGWSIDAGGRFALLASRTEVGVREFNMRGAALLADASDERPGFTPMLDLQVGLTRVMGAWSLSLGYQMQQWFGASELLTFNDDVHVGSSNRRRGDFGMDGLYVRLGVSF